MSSKYNRQLSLPKKSFFLFGPRGTGKTTWLKTFFNADLYIDLLRSETYLELSNAPEKLREKTLALPPKSKIVIDEIQRVPQLLNEVHSLLVEYENQYTFAMTGSSARKLKRNEANLLAGRAVTRYLYPLICCELDKDWQLEKILKFGSLPLTITAEDEEEKIDYLMSYVETYLKEEILQEALVRNVANYHRFLHHVALMNGQVINLNNLSRETGIPRSTLDGHFTILKDTLLGDFVEPIHLGAKVKEVSTPKFYLFDCGVTRALRQELRDSLSEEKGLLLETMIVSELKAYIRYTQQSWELYYWATPSGNEVDFIISASKKKIGIEVKSSKTWKPEFSKGLSLLLSEKKIAKAIGIYLGKERLLINGIMIYPIQDFLLTLSKGEIGH